MEARDDRAPVPLRCDRGAGRGARALGRRRGAGLDTVRRTIANLFVVGDRTPPWVERFLGVDPAALDPAESLAVLGGSSARMADELRRRRDELGVSYLVVDAFYRDVLAPVVELLDGE